MFNVEWTLFLHSTFNTQHSTFLVPPGPRMTHLTIHPDSFRDQRSLLEKTWSPAKGLLGKLTDTGHKEIGLRYMLTAFMFFAFGGIEAALMRIQLSRPENSFLSADRYNQIFTMHGTTMMFLFAVPMMLGFAVYFVPLMVG